MSGLPTGTVTFLFTDIQGSTRLLQQLGERYAQVLQMHNRALREALTGSGGHELRTEGDSFFFVFASALDAAQGASRAQRGLAAEAWPEGVAVLVRIGLHTGEASLVGREYVGLDVHRAARIAGAARGGQVLVSETTRALVEPALPPDLRLRDLGLHRLKDLARPERLFQLEVDGLPAAFPPLASLEAVPNNLPTQLTSFIGRTAELAEARRLLQRSRLLTLTGPGGTGKTRLGLQIAAESVDNFPDGVFFVPLASVRDPDLVPSAIVQALAITVAGTRLPLAAVADHLRDKHLLLVLDNFEQLLPAAPLATHLMEGAPALKLLVTSRAVLHVSGEQEYPVPPLGLPDLKALPGLEALSQYEAVQLFIERAVAVRPDFQVTNDNAAAVAGICERVDGLPLAIELAAARVKLFSPQALLNRLESILTVLVSGARDLSARQQTLRGAISWSTDLLDEGGRRLLARFSVFARGAGLEQAERVCGPDAEVGAPVVDGLDMLADQSLLRRLPELDEPRFLMLQVIREFALERLEASEEAKTIHERHARAYLELAVEAEPHFGDLEKGWLDRLERDHDNLRAALDWWVASGEAFNAMQLAACLWRFWQMRGHLQEGRTRVGQVLAMPGSRDHRAERKRLLEAAGGLAYWQADMVAAETYYQEAVELSRVLGDPGDLANALYNLAFPSLVAATDLERARPLLEEAMSIFRRLDDRPGIAKTVWATGSYYLFGRDPAAAAVYFDQARDLFRSLGRRFDLGWALRMRGLTAIAMRDAPLARSQCTQALQLFLEAHDVSGIVMLVGDFGGLVALEGDGARAITLSEAAAVHRVSTGAMLGILGTAHIDWPQPPAIDAAAEAAARARGRVMTLDQAVACALEPAATPST